MKTLVNILTFIFLAQISFGQSQQHGLNFHSTFEKNAFEQMYGEPNNTNLLALILATESTIDSSDYVRIKTELDSLNTNFGLQKSPERLFYVFKNKYFRNFEMHSSVNSIFSDSTFNCLTGSALLAYMYQSNGVEVKVQELPYHVYLKVKVKNRHYIAEATSADFGFQRLNKNALKKYLADTLDENGFLKEAADKSNNVDFAVNNEIDVKSLIGLLYYNRAIEAFNQKDFMAAISLSQKANFLYPESYRIRVFLGYCINQQLNNPTITAADKQELEQKLDLFKQNQKSRSLAQLD